MSTPVFVVNLERSVERRAHMHDQLLALGIDHTFFPAVDGRTLDLSQMPYDEKAAKHFMGRALLPAEIGCYLSHLAIMRHALEQNLKAWCILEDDAVLSEQFPQALAAITSLEQPWDLIRLHGRRRLPFVTLHPLVEDMKLVRPKKGVLGTTGYVISRQGAQKILNFSIALTRTYDKAIDRFWENGLDILAVHPSPVQVNNDFASTIAITSYDDLEQLPWLRCRWIRLKDGLRRRWHLFFRYGTV